jgi:hypothetical protein
MGWARRGCAVSRSDPKPVATVFNVQHDRGMRKEQKGLAFCCLAILLALYVVGGVNHGVLRPTVQTLPLWVPIVLGFRGSEFAKWSALPCLIIWLASTILIWLFGIAWVYVALGQFSPIDIAMTAIVAAASASGFFAALHWRTATRPFSAGAIALLFGALQFLAIWASLSPAVAHR